MGPTPPLGVNSKEGTAKVGVHFCSKKSSLFLGNLNFKFEVKRQRRKEVEAKARKEREKKEGKKQRKKPREEPATLDIQTRSLDHLSQLLYLHREWTLHVQGGAYSCLQNSNSKIF